MNTSKQQRILAVTDFTEVGDNSITHAVELAKVFNKELTLLHVIDANTKSYFKGKNIEDEVNYKLHNLKVEIEKSSSISVDIYSEEGCVCQVINKTSEIIDAILVVLGVHAKSQVQFMTPKYLLEIFKKSRVPYLVVQDKSIVKSVDEIVLPINFLKETKEKASWAAFFGRLAKSKVNVLVPSGDDTAIKNNLLFTEKLFKRFEVEYDIVNTEVNSSKIDKYALKFSIQINAGLLLVMTSKHYTLLDKIFGSKEQYLLTNKDKIPTLCISPRKDLYIPCV